MNGDKIDPATLQHEGRYLDTTSNELVTYIGDWGNLPKWRRLDGTWFQCAWEDVYVWGRFKAL